MGHIPTILIYITRNSHFRRILPSFFVHRCRQRPIRHPKRKQQRKASLCLTTPSQKLKKSLTSFLLIALFITHSTLSNLNPFTPLHPTSITSINIVFPSVVRPANSPSLKFSLQIFYTFPQYPFVMCGLTF